jgi:hypothetical protein
MVATARQDQPECLLFHEWAQRQHGRWPTGYSYMTENGINLDGVSDPKASHTSRVYQETNSFSAQSPGQSMLSFPKLS